MLVLDSPDLYPLVAGHPLVLAPYDLALVLSELLDVAVASEQADGRVETAAERRPVPGLVHAVLPDAPESYLAHDKLVVDGVPVPWRCTDGEVHAATPAGLACGLAWAAASGMPATCSPPCCPARTSPPGCWPKPTSTPYNGGPAWATPRGLGERRAIAVRQAHPQRLNLDALQPRWSREAAPAGRPASGTHHSGPDLGGFSGLEDFYP